MYQEREKKKRVQSNLRRRKLRGSTKVERVREIWPERILMTSNCNNTETRKNKKMAIDETQRTVPIAKRKRMYKNKLVFLAHRRKRTKMLRKKTRRSKKLLRITQRVRMLLLLTINNIRLSTIKTTSSAAIQMKTNGTLRPIRLIQRISKKLMPNWSITVRLRK